MKFFICELGQIVKSFFKLGDSSPSQVSSLWYSSPSQVQVLSVVCQVKSQVVKLVTWVWLESKSQVSSTQLCLQVCTGHQDHQKSILGQNPYSKRVWQNGRQSAKLVTAVWVLKRARISTTSGTHVWPVSMPRSFLLFARTQNGRGKMAAKCQVPMGYKSSKFVVGKQDSVDM